MSPAEPPKRRSNRGKTPQKLDATFELDEDKMVPFDIDHVSNIPIAVYLIKSALVVFGEWISFGGAGSTEIASEATKWVDVLKMDVTRLISGRSLFPPLLVCPIRSQERATVVLLPRLSLLHALMTWMRAVRKRERLKKLVSHVNKLADKENGVNAIGLPVIGQ